MENLLEIKNLHVETTDGTKILSGINLNIKPGEIHAIMGPNGSGKSTLSLSIMGHPNYKITNGSITFLKENFLKKSISERSKAGVFLAFQNPLEIEGVTIKDFLYQVYQSKNENKEKSIEDFEKNLVKNLKLLEINPRFVERHLNIGFSGGEKKRIETLQLAMLQPKLVILDEIDSGLDVDALKIICNAISKLKKQTNPKMAIIVITHYPRILNYLIPDSVHIIQDGTIIKTP